MAYIGNTPAEAYISISSQTFTTINGTGYTLSSSVTNSEDIALFLNNVRQKPSTYTATGTALTMGTATTTADELYCVYLGKGIQTVTPPAASVGTSSIADLAVTTAKLAGDAVTTDKILDANVTTAKTDLVSTASVAAVTAKGTSGVSDGYVTLNCDQNTHGIKLKSPPHSAAQSYTLTFPQTAPATDKYLQTDASGNLSFSTVTEYDDNVLQSNVAMLGFKVAVNGSLTRYNLVDQAIDEFYDTSGVDASASTNENRSASGSNFYYDGGSAPTITQDADDSGVDGDYTWYKWTDTGATGSYSISTAVTHEFLVVAGGGGGGAIRGGGGGAGGYRNSFGSGNTGGGGSTEADLSFGAGTSYTITVGAGGAGEVGSGGSGYHGDDGSASSISGSDITDITTVGGAGGLGNSSGSVGGRTGGSGGGMTDNQVGQTAGAGTSGQGFAGGAYSSGNSGAGGGAAAAGGVGGTVAGIGGAGLDNAITGSSVGYAGGGGGGSNNANTGTASHGGGTGGVTGVVKATSGTANTGGGGGGAYDTSSYEGGDGGSGIVVLRRLTSAGSTTGEDLTLQSTDVTALSAPTYGEFVTLIENAYGTATLNTDIKGYISRDSGTTFTQGTLVDEGTWGTNKKVLGFHDLDISSQPSGTSMCYKITTHNQSASSKETRIYATSIGWR